MWFRFVQNSYIIELFWSVFGTISNTSLELLPFGASWRIGGLDLYFPTLFQESMSSSDEPSAAASSNSADPTARLQSASATGPNQRTFFLKFRGQVKKGDQVVPFVA